MRISVKKHLIALPVIAAVAGAAFDAAAAEVCEGAMELARDVIIADGRIKAPFMSLLRRAGM